MKINFQKLFDSGIELGGENKIQAFGQIQIESPIFCSARLRFDTRIKIGAFCSINHNSEIGHSDIGRYVSIAQSCFIGGDKHPTNWLSSSRAFYTPNFRDFQKCRDHSSFPTKTFHSTGEIVRIGNDVLIANNCIINRGVNIGDGAIIAAGSVVTKDVPPYAIVGGNPAKILKYRFDEDTINQLLAIRWWNYCYLDFVGIDFTNVKEFLREFSKIRGKLKAYSSPINFDNSTYKDFIL